MKWYVDWIIEILETTPLDIWSHPMWVTRKFTAQLEQMWTEERMRRVITTLKNTNTAVEIDSSVKLPTMPFLKMAKAEGIKFCFGASSQGARINPDRLVDRHGQGTRPDAEGHVPARAEGPEADPDQEAEVDVDDSCVFVRRVLDAVLAQHVGETRRRGLRHNPHVRRQGTASVS